MPINPTFMQSWLGTAPADTVRLPLLREVMYSPSNPDGTSQACRNCVLWKPSMTACAIHDADIVATEKHVCAHHVFGAPLELPFVQVPLDEEFTGLIMADHVMCSTCVHFTQLQVCLATGDDMGCNVTVEPAARCARWSPGSSASGY